MTVFHRHSTRQLISTIITASTVTIDGFDSSIYQLCIFHAYIVLILHSSKTKYNIFNTTQECTISRCAKKYQNPRISRLF